MAGAAPTAEDRGAQRTDAVRALLAMEESYVKELRLLEKLYIVPLSMVADSPRGAIFDRADVETIFSNICELLEHHQLYLDELGRALRSDGAESGVAALANFTRQCSPCYTAYFDNYRAACDKLDVIAAAAEGSPSKWCCLGTKPNPAAVQKVRYMDTYRNHPDVREGHPEGTSLRAFLQMPIDHAARVRAQAEMIIRFTNEDDPELADLRHVEAAFAAIIRSLPHEDQVRSQNEVDGPTKKLL
ncbi:hypothetical protein AB1Y20_019851 [Prymnesium parvum]|uniref:DH domain-containing protein n=1 Tax=Prymnesium parvum TaxID=97485 RepID=A0AB34JTH7_PRYPA